MSCRLVELRMSADGKRAVALIETRDAANTTKLEISICSKIAIEGKAAIRRAGAPKLVTLQVDAWVPAPRRSRPMARAWRSCRSGHTRDPWSTCAATPAPTVFTVQAQAHTIPGVGFIGPTRLMAAANDGSVSWLLDVENKSTHPRTAPPADFNTHCACRRSVPTTTSRAMATGCTCSTQRAASIASSATARCKRPRSRSPRCRAARHRVPHPVWVEPLGDEGPEGFTAEIPSDPFNAVFRVRFADDTHLVLVDGLGGVQLVEWKTGKLVGEAGVNGSIRSVQIDAKHKLLLIDRHSTVNDSRVFELDTAQGFRGPYIVADQSYRTGLLASGPPSHKDAVLWTLDSGNRLRYYTLAELRSDSSVDEVKSKIGPPAAGRGNRGRR